jgi:DNA topoisomerase-1
MPNLKCAKSDDFFLLRDGASGLFLAASQFPKHRETRAPLISELKMVGDQLDPKYHYLLTAPEKDPEGHPAQVRFSRKTRQQYVTSEVDGKPTRWRAIFDGKRWKVTT